MRYLQPSWMREKVPNLKEIPGDCSGSIALECDSPGLSVCVEMVCAPSVRINSESQRDPPLGRNLHRTPLGSQTPYRKDRAAAVQSRRQRLYLETPSGTQEDVGRKVKQQQEK
ncbi:hypothetical protein XELAEV_18001786mg [Xenopus laevis]|nr:hypothetical protein XELAEV_18001786mg [Xenopus laevis]